MEVQLYVYDLTRGMAKVMSQQLLGIKIDAVYHTALVFNNVEYFFVRTSSLTLRSILTTFAVLVEGDGCTDMLPWNDSPWPAHRNHHSR